MDKCVLIKPDLSFESEIQLFRKEMLDANSSMECYIKIIYLKPEKSEFIWRILI